MSRRELGLRRMGWVLGLLVLGLAGEATRAQDLRPAHDRPAVLAPGPPEHGPPLALPPVELPSVPARSLAITPSGFEVLGVTAFERERLVESLEPFAGRSLTSADLLELVGAVERLYHDAGYTTTRAHLPDQNFEDGILRIRVVEGLVADVAVSGNTTHAADYYRRRLAPALAAPLHVPRLRQRLERLQASRSVDRVEAVLHEIEPGRHRLELAVEERTASSLELRLSNHRSPSIGSLGGRIDLRRRNLLGRGETFSLDLDASEGLRDVRAELRIPIAPWDTELAASYRFVRTEVVEAPFDALDIEGEFQTAAFEIDHPLVRTRNAELWIGGLAEWRASKSTLFGSSFCFQAETTDCSPSAFVLRARQEAAWRGLHRALAARSTVSFGLDGFGATRERGSRSPDGEFVSWLLQAQWAELLPKIPSLPALDGSQLLLRADLQLASAPLLGFEQIAVSGARTVRGYRHNELVRDNGWVGSVELRLPLRRTSFGRPWLELTPFFDAGTAWNGPGRRDAETLASVGAGLRMTGDSGLGWELTWGHRLRDDLPESDSLQRHGLYFEVTWRVDEAPR